MISTGAKAIQVLARELVRRSAGLETIDLAAPPFSARSPALMVGHPCTGRWVRATALAAVDRGSFKSRRLPLQRHRPERVRQ
jgi:hypothetical protein